MAKRKTGSSRKAAPDIVDPVDGPVQGNDETASKAWEAWRATRTHLSEWRQETTEAYDIVAGRQWTDEEIATLKEQLRPVVTFNRTGVVLDAVAGYEINSRQDVSFLPREVEDTGPVQVESEAAKYYRQQCDAEDEESDSFFDMLVCGLGSIGHRMDYDDDPEGMMRVERVDPLEMGYDPAATKRNLADRRWDIRGKWWDLTVAKETWPDHDFSEGANIPGDTEGLDGQKPIDRQAAAFYKDTGVGEQYDRRKGKVFILEYTWFEREQFITALNPATKKLEETDKKTLKALNDRLEAEGMPALKSVTRARRAFKRAFVHGRDTLNKDDLQAPCPHRFHYQFMTGKRDRNKNIWYGLVRPMKDPQAWSNKFMSQTMHMINANAKGGLIHEEGAFDKPEAVEKQMAKPGWRLQTRPGYGDKVRFVDPTPIPTNTFQLMQFAISSTRDTTGVNVEILGMTDRDQPGVVEHARKQSAMAILAPFFGAMRRYRKEAGRLTLYFIKEYMSDGRKIRIGGATSRQYVALTNEQGFDKYDVVVDQSPSSPNSKEAVFGALSMMLPTIMKAGVPIPPELLDYVPNLPAKLAEDWKKLLAKGPTEEQQKAARIAQAGQEAEVNKTNADALLAEAKASGEMAKIVPLLQQVLSAIGLLQTAIPGGPQPGGAPGPMPGAIPAPMPQPAPQPEAPPLMPPGMPPAIQ